MRGGGSRRPGHGDRARPPEDLGCDREAVGGSAELARVVLEAARQPEAAVEHEGGDEGGGREALRAQALREGRHPFREAEAPVAAYAVARRVQARQQRGVGGQGEESDRLAAHARRRGVGELVSLLGYVPEDEKVSELRAAWIHGLTSAKEGWGISNLEAAACGTPSVVSDAPGLRESVLHEETGLLVPHEDVGALADAIERLRRICEEYHGDHPVVVDIRTTGGQRRLRLGPAGRREIRQPI